MSELRVNPTRMVLLELKVRKKLAEKGHDLLREKMDALIMEFFAILEEFKAARQELNEGLNEAFMSLIESKMQMGHQKVREISITAPEIFSLEVDSKNVMGVKVPKFTTKKIGAETHFYTFVDTSSKFDDATINFRKALEEIIKYAEIQATLERLADEISKTRRRVNALKFLIIPSMTQTINFISLYLEERAREDIFRLKRIKARLKEAEAEVA